MKNNILVKTSILFFTVSFLTGCGETERAKYRVSFEYNGIPTQEILEGEKASKPDVVPQKEDSNGLEYVFNGWYFEGKYWNFDNEVHSDMTLYPTFSSHKKQYTVRFISGDEVLQTSKYFAGDMPFYNGKDPGKDTDDGCYTFQGWDHKITNVTKDEDYYAVLLFQKQYTIRFLADGKVLQTSKVFPDAMPEFKGSEPTKYTKEGYYTFEGWDHEITPATKNDDYNAVFAYHEDGIDFVNMSYDYHPYRDKVRSYLEAKNPDVHDYCDMMDAKQPIEIKWINTLKNINSQIFEYSLDEDFENSISINLDKNARSVKLINLLKDTTYYVRLTSTGDENTVQTSSFKTTSLGPRVMDIDGVRNVRDLGGYLTLSGKKTLQNKVIRGGALVLSTDKAYTNEITETGKKYMSEDLHIKSEFDLRLDTENLVPGRTESAIPGANLKYFGVSGYTDAFNQKAKYKALFQEFAKPSNYPIYVHCTGGADRTGTVCFLYNALLGVSYEDLIHDYEMTSFSQYGERNSRPGTTYNMSGFLQQLNNYNGETWQEKTESFLLDIGLTAKEIETIKAIAFGDEIEPTISMPDEFNSLVTDSLVISTAGDMNVNRVTVNAKDVVYSFKNNEIIINKDQLNGLNGNYDVEITYNSNKTFKKTVSFSCLDMIEAKTLFNFGEEESIDITSRTSTEASVGYNKYVKLNMKTECGTNGGVYVLIGSYGVYLRGGEFRPAEMNNGESPKEHARYTDNGISNTYFNDGNASLILGILTTETTVTYKVYVTKNNKVIYNYSYLFSSKVKNEISSENAKLTLDFLSGGDNAGSKITVLNK